MHIIPSYLLLSACFINFYYLFKNFYHFLVHQLHSVLFCLPISLGFYNHNFIMLKNSKPIISFSFGYIHILTTATNEFSSSMATFGLPECYKRKLIWIWIQGNLNQLHVGIQHCQVIPVFFRHQSSFYSLQLLSETSTVLKPVSSARAFTFYSRGRNKETISALWIMWGWIHADSHPHPALTQETRLVSSHLRLSLLILSVRFCQFPKCTSNSLQILLSPGLWSSAFKDSQVSPIKRNPFFILRFYFSHYLFTPQSGVNSWFFF